MNLQIVKEEIQKDGIQSPRTEYTESRIDKADEYRELDVLSQLKANVAQIEFLQFKLGFLVSEINSCIKK